MHPIILIAMCLGILCVVMLVLGRIFNEPKVFCSECKFFKFATDSYYRHNGIAFQCWFQKQLIIKKDVDNPIYRGETAEEVVDFTNAFKKNHDNHCKDIVKKED